MLGRVREVHAVLPGVDTSGGEGSAEVLSGSESRQGTG